MVSATNDAFRALAEGHRLMSEQLRHMSTTLDHLWVLLEVKARERQEVVRLQAAAHGLLARRLLQTLRGEKSSEEQAAVRLQVAGRGFLVRQAVRKMHMLLSSSLQCAISHSSSPIRPAAPIEIEVRVWGLPARRPTSATQQHAPTVVAASVVLAPTLVLDRSSVRTGCYILHPSSDKNPAVWLFTWDPGGHSCSPNLFPIFVFNNKDKPRCKRLNPRLRQVGQRQLVGELLRKGGEMS